MGTRTARLRDGRGPIVTLPAWVDRDPTPAEWVAWFHEQSREAQEVIATYHLAIETALNLVRDAVEIIYPRESA